jgi:hypothetical protein
MSPRWGSTPRLTDWLTDWLNDWPSVAMWLWLSDSDSSYSHSYAYGKTAREQRVHSSSDHRLVTAAGASPTMALSLTSASFATGPSPNSQRTEDRQNSSCTSSLNAEKAGKILAAPHSPASVCHALRYQYDPFQGHQISLVTAYATCLLAYSSIYWVNSWTFVVVVVSVCIDIPQMNCFESRQKRSRKHGKCDYFYDILRYRTKRSCKIVKIFVNSKLYANFIASTNHNWTNNFTIL